MKKKTTENRFLQTPAGASKKRPAGARQTSSLGDEFDPVEKDLLKVKAWWRVIERRAIEATARGEEI